jgi:hypothetical protein
MTTNLTIKKILSGSCTPATDLLNQVRNGLDESEALEAYNSRLFPKDRVVTLADAARNESDFQRVNNI